MHGFSIAGLLFPHHGDWPLYGLFFQPVPIFHAVLVLILLMGTVFAFRRQLVTAGGDILPRESFDFRNLFELLVEYIVGLMRDIIGPKYRTYVPLVAGLWIWILFQNFFGLLPYLSPPTDNVNTTLSMAVIVFLATHYYGIKVHGFKYIHHFLSPVWPPTVVLILISPFYLVIELIGHVARILSLSIRLFANMFADHTVISIFLMLTAPFVPSIFMGMGVIVCLLQAFIFSLLTIIYISLAVHEAEEHEEHEKHGASH
jgi:F-type H+-transporting ATPase subunit a